MYCFKGEILLLKRRLLQRIKMVKEMVALRMAVRHLHRQEDDQIDVHSFRGDGSKARGCQSGLSSYM